MIKSTFLSTADKPTLLRFINENPFNQIALTSLVLGIMIGCSIALIPYLSFTPLLIYLIALSTFHFLEFYITSIYQVSKLSKDSFLIFSNGSEYLICHSIALFETLIELVFFSSFKTNSYGSKLYLSLKIIGFGLIIVGQVLRSWAMINAGESFSHIIANDKKSDHVLVTSGIYSISRHPSYAGFFYWAVGTQLMLLNPVSFVLFAGILFKFFSGRIRYEEFKLIQFFGDDYVRYKRTTPVGIPFIK